MNRQTGSALIDYVLPLALIGLIVGLGIYYIFSSGSLQKFFSASANLKIDPVTSKAVMGNDSISENIINKPKGGSLGGTEENPKMLCRDDNTCIIDYGKFVLEGVPKNFNEYIRTSGGSGGTEKISLMLLDLANYLEESGDILEAENVKKLAVLGHNIAAVEKELEKKVNACNGDKSCIDNFRYQVMPLPEGFDDSYYAFPQNASYEAIWGQLAMGWSRWYKENQQNTFDLQLTGNNISAVFINQLDLVSSSSKIPDSVKGLIRELSWDIGTIAEDFENNMYYVADQNSGNQGTVDPLTGLISQINFTSNPYENFANYNASRISHFDSALICASGNGMDPGTSCH